MLNITLNNQTLSLQNIATLSDLLMQEGFDISTPEKIDFSVSLNGSFIPRGQYAKTPLNEGDAIILVTPMQGG